LKLTDDRTIVERAKQGEQAAFGELVERYKKKIYTLSLDMTGNHHDAEDMSQEVFIRAFRSLDGFQGNAAFGTWLYRIAVNMGLDRKRNRMAGALIPKENVEGIADLYAINENTNESDPERQAESSLIRHNIDRALQSLSLKERSVFVLRHYHDLKFDEIAYVLQISVGTVKSTLFRALQRLQKDLAFYGEEFGQEKSHASLS
jgi:RNA polymerase sigma-70 factor (ECF subfamily)